MKFRKFSTANGKPILSHLVILILIAALSISVDLSAQQSRFEGFEYGDFDVGFEVIDAVDHSRRYQKFGEKQFVARPMVLGVWFPISDGVLESDDINQLYQIAYSSAEGIKSDQKKLADQISSKQIREEGTFPIIIYATGRGSAGYENIELCKMLASHGYIVALTASKGAYSRNILFRPSGVEAQVRDLEFLYGWLHNYDHADTENIGVVGYSFGALNMVGFALKHKAVDAMVAYDGILTGGPEMMNSFPTMDMSELETSMLSFFADNWYLSDYKLDVLAPNTNHIAIRTSGLDHPDFNSYIAQYGDRPEYVRRAFVSIANRTRQFLDIYLKNFPQSQEITILDDELFIEIINKKSEKSLSLTREDFLTYLYTEGIDAALNMYSEIKVEFPEYQLIDFDLVTEEVGVRLEAGETDIAIQLMWMLIDAYPKNMKTYLRLAETFIDINDDVQADAVLRRGLQVDPENENLKKLIQSRSD